ncbi:MAG: outer membrane protein assembly factor BamA [Nitrospirota bacterium]
MRVVLYLLITALVCASPRDAASAVAGEIKIDGLISIGRDELLYLLDIQPGKDITGDSVRLGIKRAFLKGIFEDISVETDGGARPKVNIRVKERSRIEKISLEGDYALSGRRIKKLFMLQEGQLLPCDIIERAVNNLKTEIEKLGYPRADIKAEVRKLDKPNEIEIRLKVDTGAPDIIKSINVSGAPDDIKRVIKLSEGDMYSLSAMKKDTERIEKYYKDQGYIKPVVTAAYQDGILSVRLQPGKRLEIALIGNESISSKELRREMPFFEAEEVNEDIAEEAVQRMLGVYRAKGYPFAQITSGITEKDGSIQVSFSVSEGSKVKIGNVSFLGISLPQKNLEQIMSLRKGKPYNPALMQADRETLENFYNSLGYLQVEISEFETKYDESAGKMDIVIKVWEGPKTEIGEIAVTGTINVPEAEVRKAIPLKPGDPYNEVDVSNARFKIIEFYNSKGFPDTTVEIMRDFDGRKAHVTFRIEEGKNILFGKVIITGNQKTKYVVVQRELKQKEGMPFDYGILTQDRQRLYKLGLFTDINIEVRDTYDHQRDVLMHLREGNAGSVEFGFGYADYERFRGFVDLSYRNLWGMNRRVSLRGEASSLEKRLILQYYEPWFLDIPLPFRVIFLSEDREEIDPDSRDIRYHLTRQTVSAGVEKQLSERIKSELYYEFSYVNTFDVQPDVVLSREDTGTLIISGLRLGLIYDTRDNAFEPTKGVLAGMSTKFTSPILFSETDFVKVNFYGDVYKEAVKGIVLAASLRGGFSQGYNKTRELPIVERFFLGGGTTVRGYAQDSLGPKGSDGNPTGGNLYLMENLEVRTNLGKGIGLVAFLDGGNVWVNWEDFEIEDMKFTTGLGVRYSTAVGPLRVDYGHKLQKERGESSGEIHFSIGHAF